MAHFAKVLNGRVTNVIKAEQDFFDTFIDDSPGEWIQTSYNTKGGIHYGEDGNPDGGVALRYNFAHIDGHYDREVDAFYSPKQFDSWVLNTENYTWQPPIERPDDGKQYTWDEDNEQWTPIS